MPNRNGDPSDRSRLGSVFLSRLLTWLKRRPNNHERDPIIVPFSEGFHILVGDETLWSIYWERVVEVVAFKRDLWSTDLICLGFTNRGDSNRSWCIHEELNGFQAIVPAIDALTHGALTEKWHGVMLPAFQTNWTIIWTKDGERGLNEENPLLIWGRTTEESESGCN